MTWVPRNRHTQLEKLRSGRQKAIIVGGVPIPAGEMPFPGELAQSSRFIPSDERDEVHRETELMRGLERSRFRNAFGDHIALPHGVAISLEDFETGLRAAGLVSVDQILVQSGGSGRKFRVAKRQVRMDGHLVTSEVEKPSPQGTRSQHSAVVTEGEGARSLRVRIVKKSAGPRF